jgi:predicted nucleotidyltransferase
MKSTQEYISILSERAPILRARFGMTSMSLFGSVVRGEQTDNSDVDVLVDMPATLRGVGGANDYLEQITGKHVDMILRHRNLTPFFLKEIERDGIRIF